MAKSDILVSVVAVLRDQAGVLPRFADECLAVLAAHYADYELILIDNGSADDTAGEARRLVGRSRCVRYIKLSRPMAGETAEMAGLDAAIGDYVATLHPDFDPPAELVRMVEACRKGADVVLGVDATPPRLGPAYRLARRAYRAVAKWLLRIDLPTNLTALRVFSRGAVNALTKVRLRKRQFAVLLSGIGLVPAYHPYHRRSLSGGRPRPNLWHAARIGLSVLVHNTILPLRLVSLLGVVGSLASFGYSLYVVGVYIVKRDVAPGWTTLSLQVSGLFALAFLMLALLGEYLGRLLEESTDRPLYFVREERSSEVMLSDLTRKNVLGESADPPPPPPVS